MLAKRRRERQEQKKQCAGVIPFHQSTTFCTTESLDAQSLRSFGQAIDRGQPDRRINFASQRSNQRFELSALRLIG
jgi:hypothetical protein